MMTKDEVNALLQKPVEDITQADLDAVKQSYDEAKRNYEIETAKCKASYLNNNERAINDKEIPNIHYTSQYACNRFVCFKNLLDYVKKTQITVFKN